MDSTWITTTFVLIDTAMTNLDHHTDMRASVPDSEVATIALCDSAGIKSMLCPPPSPST